jgi:hypothetical protein
VVTVISYTTGTNLQIIRHPPEGTDGGRLCTRRDRNKPPLAQLNQGPYAVVKRGPKVFTLQVGRQTKVVSVDRLKPHPGCGQVEAATPMKKGQPPSNPGGGKEDNPSPVAFVDEGWMVVTS